MTKILAWHFLNDDGSYCYGNGKPRPGGTETVSIDKRPLKLYYWGLHASRNIIDALGFARGCLLRRVELGGEMVKYRDEVCATRRHELWRMDITNILHEFACWCAERAVKRLPEPYPQFENALKTKRAWLRGECNDETLGKICSNVQNAQWDILVKIIPAMRDTALAVETAMSPCGLVASKCASHYGQVTLMKQTREDFARQREKDAQRRKLLRMIEKARKEKGL